MNWKDVGTVLVLLILIATVFWVGVEVYQDFLEGYDECIRLYGECEVWNKPTVVRRIKKKSVIER